MLTTQTRRRFLATTTLASAAGLIVTPPALAGEPPLETTTVRLGNTLAAYDAPIHAAADLLRAEGFTDVRYVDTGRDACALKHWDAANSILR
jgi:NitT/TauT family transport system substrate-binding protein